MDYSYELITQLCKKNGVNITKMCKDCNITRSKLTDYKNGRIKSLSLNTLTKLADYFEVPISYFCGSSLVAAHEEQLKALLFGEGYMVTDEMWQKVKEFAQKLKEEA